MKLAVDTKRYTDLCRGERSAVETIEYAEEVWLPFIVLGELRADLPWAVRDRATTPYSGIFY